jgi:hypothetical protein
VNEAVRLLAARAPKLGGAAGREGQARVRGDRWHPYPVDRVTADRPFYSGSTASTE